MAGAYSLDLPKRVIAAIGSIWRFLQANIITLKKRH